jgi:adenosylcobinamide-phosphate synthase
MSRGGEAARRVGSRLPGDRDRATDTPVGRVRPARLRQDRRVMCALRPTSRHAAAARATGIALGVLIDVVLGDPARHHPVAGFGRLAAALERRCYRDDVGRGLGFTVVAVSAPVAVGALAERWGARRPALQVLLTAAATWAVIGGTSLAREGLAMARSLEAGDLPAARDRLSHLCARDPADMQSDDLARATVESLAENTSDAVVAPLLWGALLGAPGLLGYRAVNTLDAMVGYRSPRYRRFGWASARSDDVLNLVPARLTGALMVLCAPFVAGRARAAWRVMLRDAPRHPSPNAGWPEAAAAGALGVRLGGRNTYHGQVEERAGLGDGRAPSTPDVRRAVRLERLVTGAGALVAVLLASRGGRTR